MADASGLRRVRARACFLETRGHVGALALRVDDVHRVDQELRRVDRLLEEGVDVQFKNGAAQIAVGLGG